MPSDRLLGVCRHSVGLESSPAPVSWDTWQQADFLDPVFSGKSDTPPALQQPHRSSQNLGTGALRRDVHREGFPEVMTFRIHPILSLGGSPPLPAGCLGADQVMGCAPEEPAFQEGAQEKLNAA